MIEREQSLRFYVVGRVQGVGFRRWAVREATALHLTGWIRNRYDGRVEIFIKGEEASLEKFIFLCRKGPLFSRVLGLDFNLEIIDTPSFIEGEFIKLPNY